MTKIIVRRNKKMRPLFQYMTVYYIALKCSLKHQKPDESTKNSAMMQEVFLIIYRILFSNDVEVLRVLHGARDLDEIFS
jgi:hypothetical protein